MDVLKDLCISMNSDPYVEYLQYKEYIHRLRKLVSSREVKDLMMMQYPRSRIQRKLKLTESVLMLLTNIPVTRVYLDIDGDRGIPLKAAYNATLKLMGDKIIVCARVVTLGSEPFEGLGHRSFIACGILKLDDILHCDITLRMKPSLYSFSVIENVEDPFFSIDLLKLFHNRVYLRVGVQHAIISCFSDLEVCNATVKACNICPLLFEDKDILFIPSKMKDAFLLNDRIIVFKYYSNIYRISSMALAQCKYGMVIPVETIHIYGELLPIEGEVSTGPSCGVKISSNEYLLLLRSYDENYISHYFVVLVDTDGNLLGVSRYPIYSSCQLKEIYYGFKPGIVFFNGAALYREYVIFSGGCNDERIIMLYTELDKLLEKLKFVQG